MATLRMMIAADPARLLDLAADGLFPVPAPTLENPWPTLSAWVILRQGGLRDDFHTLAAERGVPGWFDSPVAVLDELPSLWASPASVPLTDAEATVLLGDVLRRTSAGVFGVGDLIDHWIPAVSSLLGEFVAEGITAREFASACNARNDRDAFEIHRDDSLAHTLSEWTTALTRLGRTDTRASIVDLSKAISAEPQRFTERLGGRREVRIVGLASLRGGYGRLLRALRDSPALDTVTIISSHQLDFPDDLVVETLEDTQDAGAAAALARCLFVPGAEGTRLATPPVKLIEAPDIQREVKTIAVRVRDLLDKGVMPSRVAVVFRNERPGVDAMAAALRIVGVPVTAPRRIALRETSPARAVRALLTASAESWSVAALKELTAQPLLRVRLRPAVLDAAAALVRIRSLDDWEPALLELVTRCVQRDEAPAGGMSGRTPLPRTRQAERCLDAWGKWLPVARSLDEPRTTSAWFQWLHATLEDQTLGIAGALEHPPGGDMYLWQVERRACAKLSALAIEWGGALDTVGVGGVAGACMHAEAFRALLDPLLTTDIVTEADTGFGVVVGEAMATAWRSFDHVFVAGLVAEEFPSRATVSPLMRDEDRLALIQAGLVIDEPRQWAAREEQLFRTLCASPRTTLTLSWSCMSGDGREVNRSRFIDDVAALLCPPLVGDEMDADQALSAAGLLVRVTPQQVIIDGYPLIAGTDARETAMHAISAADIEKRRTREASLHNGRIDDDALEAVIRTRYDESYVWSATQLEGLAKCPWSWFAERLLRLPSAVDPAEEGVDNAAFGTLLHATLDRFFDAARRERQQTSIRLLPEDAWWAMPLLAKEIDEVWISAEQITSLGHPSFRDVVRAELVEVARGYLKFEMEFNAANSDNGKNAAKQLRMGVHAGELAFDSVPLIVGDTTFLLRGSIDRVDVGSDDRFPLLEKHIAAIDYKTTEWSTPAGGKAAGWEDGVVLQVPLYAAVLRALYPEATLSHMEYRILRKPGIKHQLKFFEIQIEKGKQSTIEGVDDSELRMSTALEAAARRVRMARSGELPTAPVDSCGCSPYCVARDICRVPGGPVSNGWTR